MNSWKLTPEGQVSEQAPQVMQDQISQRSSSFPETKSSITRRGEKRLSLWAAGQAKEHFPHSTHLEAWYIRADS
jgi:hypothetical protein